MPEKNKQILTALTLIVFLATGLFIRLGGISEWVYSPDNVLHISYAQAPDLRAVFNRVIYYDNHPPGFFFLLHWMLEVSDNQYFLRSLSYIPGLILVIIAYFIGKKFSGRATGLTMAFAVSFNYDLVFLSETMRQYMMLLCLECLALLEMLKYDESRKTTQLYNYGILCLLALNVNYTIVIFALGAGSLWFLKLLMQKNYRHLTHWVFIHTCLAGFFAMMYIFKTSTETMDPDLKEAVSKWLKGGFPDIGDIQAWGFNLFKIIGFEPLSFRNYPYQYWVFAPFITLVIWLIFTRKVLASRQYTMLILLLILIAINIGLSIAKIYPFTDDRHCIYLLPFCLLPISYFFVYLGSKAGSLLIRLGASETIAQYSGYIILMVFSGLVVFAYFNNQFFRVGNNDFLITQENYIQSIQYLNANTRPGDNVVTERAFVDYLFYGRGNRNDEVIKGKLHHLKYNSRNLYYFDDVADTALFEINDLREMLVTLEQNVPGVKQQRLCFFTLGWRNESLHYLIIPAAANIVYVEDSDHSKKLAELFKTSPEITNRFYSDGSGAGVGFITNWPFLEHNIIAVKP